jgi:hypothetical protein
MGREAGWPANYRSENGPFIDRKQLKEITSFGWKKAYQQGRCFYPDFEYKKPVG